MKSLLLALTLCLVMTSNLSAKELQLGNTVKMELEQPIESLLANPQQFVDKEVTIKGTIGKVCKKRGCWADFESGNSKLRVKVADGEIEIPLHTIGSEAYASGVFVAKHLNKEQTIAYLKHMAKDAGEAFDETAIENGITLYQLKSNAVKIL